MTLLHQAAQKAVEALKPCPFCQSEGRTYFNGSYWAVLCNKCEGEGPPSDHEGGAIAYWNGRLQESALQQQPEPVAWYWEHVMQSSHGIIEAGFSGSPVEVTDNAMWDGKVATIVTELHAGRRLLPPKIAVAMGLPTELSALQQQEVPREPVAYRVREIGPHGFTEWSYPQTNFNGLEDELRRHPGREVQYLAGIGTYSAAVAASPSTTQQQEAGNGWRSIETVPKDGREIILREGSRVGAACWVKWPGTFYSDGTPKDDGGEGWTVGYDGDEWADPTHWQAMPATPSTPESAEKDDAGGGGGNDGR